MRTTTHLPKTFLDRTDREDIEADVASARGLTPEQRGQVMVSLCQMAAEQIAQHPDPQKTLDWQDPITVETQSLLLDLWQQGKHHAKPPNTTPKRTPSSTETR